MSNSGDIFSIPTIPEVEDIEPEIARELKTPKMIIPDKESFAKFVSVDQFDKYTPETREILHSIATLSNQNLYALGWLRLIVFRLRQDEAAKIRADKKFPKVLGKLGYIAFGAIISIIFDKLFHP